MPHTLPAVEEARSVLAVFTDLPVTSSVSAFGPARYHVRGRNGGLLHDVNVYVHSLEEAVTFAHEARAHLSIPPVWTAYAGQPIQWAGGFMAVRKACFPRGGRFRSARSVNVAALLREAGIREEYRAAWRSGARDYLRLLWAAVNTEGSVPQAAD